MFKIPYKTLLYCSISTALLSGWMGAAYCETQHVDSMPVKIHMHNGQEKIIQLIKIKLSKSTRNRLFQNMHRMMIAPKTRMLMPTNIPLKDEVGMNGLPVLDQGVWGTCATFAATAAVDALLSLQNNQMVSQLCNLEVGRALYNPGPGGGWNGSFGNLVLNQITQNGYITQAYQQTKGCGGLKQYPLRDSSNNGTAMTVALFSAHSVRAFTYRDWRPLLSFNGRFAPISSTVGSRALAAVKTALLANHRVVFGTLLAPFVGSAGAEGEFHTIKNDTWTLTPEVTNSINSGIIAGHEMVIVGYDDKACATYIDKQKVEHKQCGILHLRNSWSVYAGDQGSYYMTYDYFKTMAIEAYEVGKNVR